MNIWIEKGLFSREKLIYENTDNDVYWVTYGRKERKKNLGNNVKVLEKKFLLPDKLYSLILPLLLMKQLRGVSLLKTNQLLGSWSAIIASKLYRKPVIVRTGYIASLVKRRNKMRGILLLEFVEKICYRSATLVVVTTEDDKEYISKKYQIEKNRILVIPNFVDLTAFKPKKSEKIKKRVVTVSRLNEEKNLEMLIEALSETDIGLDLVGEGNLKDRLEKQAKQLNVDIRFLGRVDNALLPDILCRYKLFVLVSHYEGMPKALIEAMACGLPIVATNVPNINKILEHTKTGFLVRKTKDDIKNGILTVLNDANLARKLALNSLDYCKSNYSLEKIIELEKSSYKLAILNYYSKLDTGKKGNLFLSE